MKCVISWFGNLDIPGHNAIITDVFRSVSSSEMPVFSCLYPEDGGTKLLQNVNHCLPVDTALFSRIPGFPINCWCNLKSHISRFVCQFSWLFNTLCQSRFIPHVCMFLTYNKINYYNYKHGFTYFCWKFWAFFILLIHQRTWTFCMHVLFSYQIKIQKVTKIIRQIKAVHSSNKLCIAIILQCYKEEYLWLLVQ